MSELLIQDDVLEGLRRLKGSGGAAHVFSTGPLGTQTFAAFWADSTYADADKWTSSTGCNFFEVLPWDEPWLDNDGGPVADQGLVIAWSTTEDADLSTVIAAMMTGAASVAKTAKETTLTEQTNCFAWNGSKECPRVFSATPIKTIRICGMADMACILHTVTVA